MASKLLKPDNVQPKTDDEETVALIKEYSVPEICHRQTTNDKLRHATIDLGLLRAELKRIKSRCARLENEIEAEVKMLIAALDGEQETYDQVKRRISRLKGSLEYPGHE
jgi:hypothetical protein